MAIEVGIPTNFYHYTAGYENGHSFTTASTDDQPSYDDGVFVVNNPSAGSDFMNKIVKPSDYRETSLGYWSLGGLNMETTATSYTDATRISISAKNGSPALRVFKGGFTSSDNGICKFWKSSSEYELMSYANGTLTIHKTELACPYKYYWNAAGGGVRNAECVYVTGISAIMQYLDGTKQHQTVIFARLPPVGKDYPVISITDVGIVGGLPASSTNAYSKDGSVIFYDDGTVESACITGTSLSGVSASELSLAMSGSVLGSNTGIMAVACMVSGDGYARWVGYKNGIYKVYQGSEPLYGMPGERMTIKGHEFVCLAYGPFYARLS